MQSEPPYFSIFPATIPKNAETWVRNIIASRKPCPVDGGNTELLVTYDGENYTVKHTVNHTRASGTFLP
jgi:hypothetical protein